jgi:hypothetical protein
MFQRTLAIVLVAFLLVNVTWQQERLVLSNSKLDTTDVGLAQSLIKLLVAQNETTYNTVTGDTVNSIAQTYYGVSSFALLIVRGNAALDIQSTTSVLTVGTKLRLPSVLLCPQFVGVDCVLTSYQQSLPLGSTNNYWKNLPQEIQSRVGELMKYPQYTTFIMSALTSEDLNPTLSLNIQISNYASADLTNGTITFTTGFGQTPDAVVPVNSISNYRAQRSDILHGIHGTLSYLMKDKSGQQQAFSLTFHVYAGNGSIWNTFSFDNQVETGAPTSQNSGFRNLQIGSTLVAWSSITKSPEVQLNIVLQPFDDPLILGPGLRMIANNQASLVVIEGVYADFMDSFRSFVYQRNDLPWQNWRFVSLNDEWKHRNQFRIVTDNSSHAMTANEAQSVLSYEDPNENNKNQIWSVIPIGTLYQIRSNNGLCLHAALGLTPRSPPGTLATTPARELWLESCDATNENQKWQLINQTQAVA